MTTKYINDLFEIFKKIIKSTDKQQKEILITSLIGKCYENLTNINNLFTLDKTNFIFNGDKIKINEKEYGNDEIETGSSIILDELFKYNYKGNESINNNYIKFIILIDKIREIFNNGYVKEFLELNIKSFQLFGEDIKEDFLKANAQILKKNKEILNFNRIIKFNEKITKIQNLQILQSNKDEYKQIIDDFVLNISEKIINYSNKYEEILTKIKTNSPLIKSIDELDDKFISKYLNNYFNIFLKNVKKIIIENLNRNENKFIKILFDHFKKTIYDFKFPSFKEEVIEDLEKKYLNFKTNIYDKKDDDESINIKVLLKYEDLFNTNNGEWKIDSKKNPIIKEYKELYDKLLAKLKPENVEVNKEFTELYNYSEKIKLINEKIKKGEKIQNIDYDFINNFDNIIELILSKNPENEELKKQVEIVKKAFEEIKIKDNVKEEKKQGRVVDDVISEKDRDLEALYFNDYITFFKLPLKILTYGTILFTFIVLFISFLGLLILIYDFIINTITLFVNSENSTNNLSLDYITKSIINCSKDNYDKDRFYILTEQKQNLSIFNIAIYILYLLIIYFITYIILIFYTSQMKLKFIGSFNDIDKNLIYLPTIVIIFIYSLIHLFIFKYFFKPYVYIPYKTINDEENEIDKMIAEYIIIRTNDNKIVKFNDLFELLYDASKIEELSDYFLSEIKNEDFNGCLRQKIIIYNLYEYLRQYVVYDDDFKYNFKIYCSTDENNKPTYENGNKITFISMLKKDEIKIISNFHEELNFINKLDDKNIEFYNKLNTDISDKIKNINKKIITHNKTTLPFFITIIYMIIIFLLNLCIVYIIIKNIKDDKTDAYHKYIIDFANFLDKYIYNKILTNLKIPI